MRFLLLIVMVTLAGCQAAIFSGGMLFSPDIFDTRTEAQKTVAWCSDHLCE